MNDIIISDALSYGESLVGIPYKWWTGEKLRSNKGPFWAHDDKREVPKDIIESCSCTGLINLIRRKFGLSIPGFSDPECEYPGGTYEWFRYLTEKNEPIKFDISKRYKKGSLLFRPYTNIYDQGHDAILLTDDKDYILDNKLLHCYPDSSDIKPGYIKPGITVDTEVRSSHFWIDSGFYLYVFGPESWLNE